MKGLRAWFVLASHLSTTKRLLFSNTSLRLAILIFTLFVNQEAECEKEKMDVAYQAQTNIADSSREFQMQKASYDQEVNTRKAEAELSYELQVQLLSVICQAENQNST